MLIGKRVNDRYKILRLIGGGGMANVYLAHDIILDRDVAIKILRLDFAHEDEFIRRFQREAQSATSLAHENIVSIYDVGEENDIYYIVMEFVDGMTLKEYIQNYHPIPIEKTIDIMKQLASAVAHAHENQIVHRDIKPQNILINQHGQVMITDFGIAMALSATSITQTNSVLGSVHYLSPEQARGGMATKKSDIYSLGIVMFELLTGRLPFFGESAISIALKHLQSETPSARRWNPNIPQSVENIVLKATAKDPFRRYENVEEMYQDLETALDPERANEEKFVIPEDHDATKAIPIINREDFSNTDDNTIMHSKESSNTSLEQKKGPKKKRKKWPWVLSGVFVALILIGFSLVYFILPAIREAQNVTIPNLAGDEYEVAALELIENGLKVGEVFSTPSDDVPEGAVIRTSPDHGQKVKKGYSVNIYLSSGKEKFTLDDYRGKQISQIESLLSSEGFKIVVEEEYADSPEGEIIEQSPAPSEEVVPDDTVLTFVVSKGEEKIQLEDLRGYNTKGLDAYSRSTGLNIDMSEEAYSDEVQEGLVISQDPAPDTMLSKGDMVKVIISKGKEEIPPRTVTREFVILYEPTEEGEPQEVQILIEDFHHKTMSVPAKTLMIEEDTVIEIEFTIEKDKKASYKIVRDNNVIASGDVDYPDEE